MIDWVSFSVDYEGPELNGGYVVSLSPDGEIDYEIHKRLECEGSFDHKISARSLANSLYVSGNPSKFLQGHNLFGTWDIHYLCLHTVLKIFENLEIKSPITIKNLKNLDYKFTRIDITESFSLGSRLKAKDWIFACKSYLSSTHQETSFDSGTCYIGKHSKRLTTKLYYKGDEFIKHPCFVEDENKYEILKTWSLDKIRIEFTLRGKWLEDYYYDENRQEYVKIPTIDKNSFVSATDINSFFKKKYFSLNFARNLNSFVLQGTYKMMLEKKVKLPKEACRVSVKLEDVPRAARGTFMMYQQGIDVKNYLPKATFYRHKKIIFDELGIDIKQPSDATRTSHVVPLIRAIEAVPAGVPLWSHEMGLVVGM